MPVTVPFSEITSLQNPRIKNVVRLRDRPARDEQGKMIIEGYRGLDAALKNGYTADEFYFCEELFLGENEPALIAGFQAQGAEVFKCTRAVFEKIAYRERPEGILAVAPQRRRGLADMPAPAAGQVPLYLIAEAIEKPGNLGTMLRTADGTGVTAIILCDKGTDIFNPNVVRASIGTLFTVPIIECSGDEAIAWCRQHQVKILAATPHTETVYTDVDMTRPVAVVVGTEKWGLSDQWMTQADLKVVIPMLGQADSLNVATATSLLLYEAVRQRRKHV
jgi:TrmH family RNA methyltransferase